MNLTHHFLIAMPTLGDPNFQRTVVFLLRSTDDGSFGLVINRPSGLSLHELCADQALEYNGPDGDVATLDLIQTTAPTSGGGIDTIITGVGNDIVLGGDKADSITATDGDNVVLGDLGQVVLHTGELDLIASTEFGQATPGVVAPA